MAGTSATIDRLTIMQRPRSWPLVHQNWGKLLFIHWPLPVEVLRPLIPPELELDTYDRQAWVGVIPFTMWDIRPILLPALPGFSAAHELNVRTYVHYKGIPGVWFFSLDINQALAVWAGRLGYGLPYYPADIDLRQNDRLIQYTLTRRSGQSPQAEFDAQWIIGEPLLEAEAGSLEFFLTERYCLYTSSNRALYRARIWHQPWRLHRAELQTIRSTMMEAVGLPTPVTRPVVHYAEKISAEIWPLSRVTD